MIFEPLSKNLDLSEYVFLQNALSELNSQLTDAKTWLFGQETEIKSINSKLQISLSEMENLKTSLAAKKKT